jgi:hypothetical protein
VHDALGRDAHEGTPDGADCGPNRTTHQAHNSARHRARDCGTAGRRVMLGRLTDLHLIRQRDVGIAFHIHRVSGIHAALRLVATSCLA